MQQLQTLLYLFMVPVYLMLHSQIQLVCVCVCACIHFMSGPINLSSARQIVTPSQFGQAFRLNLTTEARGIWQVCCLFVCFLYTHTHTHTHTRVHQFYAVLLLCIYLSGIRNHKRWWQYSSTRLTTSYRHNTNWLH
jgi:hypothetical protein